ncbi:MAG: hypothetical protein HY870_05740 [Chloroflexi bacterium]|nr:hypothetical protein [Chloroflexota bacterium]
METIKYRKWVLGFNKAANEEAYRQLDAGEPETCGCGACRNFAQVRDRVYPAEVQALFAQIGIDFRKEAEVYQLYRHQSGWHVYGGFLHMIGRIVAGPDSFPVNSRSIGAIDLEQVDDQFSIGFTGHVAGVRPPFFEQPLIQIEFLTEVPWVRGDIDEPE